MVRTWAKTLAFAAMLLAACLAAADIAIPPLKARVTDLTSTLSPAEKVQLEQKLADLEALKGSQVAVLILPSTQPETIEQYSIRVADAWKLGRKGVDDGALLVVAKQDRAVRIEVGYGLEGVLPDAIAKRIVEETIIPQFRQGNFAAGINAGTDQIIRVIEGETLPPPKARRGAAAESGGFLDNLIFIFIILLIAGKVLQSLFGRFVGATIMGASAGFLGWLLFSSIIAGVIIAVLAFLTGLFGSPGGGFYHGGRGGWYGGGGFGGRGGGDFGGGGFSGGGGGFGGGGASGRW
jgi:uncharacterized protein